MSKDINFFSIYANTYTIDAGSNDAKPTDTLPTVFNPDNPERYSDILKLSHIDGLSLSGIRVIQGREDAVDINICRNVTLAGEFGGGSVNGSQVFTVKGGSKNITLSGTCHGHRIEIGNWSDQSNDLTENVTLNLRSIDGKPINVSVGRGRNVKVSGDCRISALGSVLLKLYWWFKRIVIRRFA